MEALKDRVKQARQSLKMTQRDLCQKAGITQATLCRIESGKIANPKANVIRRLSIALGVTADYLLCTSAGPKETRLNLPGEKYRFVIVDLDKQNTYLARDIDLGDRV